MDIILDSAVFINATRFPFEINVDYFIPSKCVGEIKGQTAKLRFDVALQQFKITIQDPCPVSVEKVQKLAEKWGDTHISQADENVIALALEKAEQGRKVLVYTDDFSIQNLLKWEKIPFSGVLQGNIQKAKSFKKTNST
jgi:rRNA maturation endonuclease Nob1